MELKTHLKRGAVVTTIVGSAFAANANAALDSALIDALKTEVLADIGLAVAAGFGIMTVVVASSIGMAVLGRFVSKGASGG